MDAVGTLEARAWVDGPERLVYTRVGEHGGAVYVDLVNGGWETVEITSTDWRVVPDPPVMFRRARGMRALATPVPGGSLNALRQFVNVADDRNWMLIVGWLLGAAWPSGPYPILVLHGEQGSAKSTTARVLRALLDPNAVPLRSESREDRDLMIAATNSWIVNLDNLSRLSGRMSDALCRLATGGGFATRELYTDAEEALFEAQRPVILNGIEELATRSDLLDRSIIVYLPTIPDERRRAETEFWREFEAARPSIQGALYDAVSATLRALPGVALEAMPRMADFACRVVAAEPALGWPTGAFLAAYAENREAANELPLEASPVAEAMRTFAEQQSEWAGTATELLERLQKLVDEAVTRQKGWPKAAHALSNTLGRLAPNLRAVGVSVAFSRAARRRSITVRKIAEESVTSVTPAMAAQTPVARDDDRNGAVTRGEAGVTPPTPGQSPPRKPRSDARDDNDASLPLFTNRDIPEASCEDPQQARPCHWCKGTRYWRSRNSSTLICAICHPPARASLVAEWVDVSVKGMPAQGGSDVPTGEQDDEGC
ncbi:MAG TPA: hypothetical protein VKV57_14880 [bacterium]|nr:hypothetical protein [bacterium]